MNKIIFLILSHNELSIVHFFIHHTSTEKQGFTWCGKHSSVQALQHSQFDFSDFSFSYVFLFFEFRNFPFFLILLETHLWIFPFSCLVIFLVFLMWKFSIFLMCQFSLTENLTSVPAQLRVWKIMIALHACNVLAAEQMKKFKVSLGTLVGKPPDYQYKKKIKEGQSLQLAMEMLKRRGSTHAWNSHAWEINDRRLWTEAMLGCILTLHLRGE